MRRVPRLVFLLAVLFLALTAMIGCHGGHFGRHHHAHHDRPTWAHGGGHAAPRAERRTLKDGPLLLRPSPAVRQAAPGPGLRTPLRRGR